jgi:hypothetical protein
MHTRVGCFTRPDQGKGMTKKQTKYAKWVNITPKTKGLSRFGPMTTFKITCRKTAWIKRGYMMLTFWRERKNEKEI